MFDSGKTIDEATIKAGLLDLQPGLHFDMGVKLGIPHPFQSLRQGVFYNGKHICSMDRGMIPELKVWTVQTILAPCSLAEADHDDAVVRWREVLRTHPGYTDLYEAALENKLDDHYIRNDGKLVHIEVCRPQKLRGRVVSVGWRHTFERLLRAKIPGITRQALAAKFGVDMYKYPLGPPEDVYAALTEE